ncbi:hypothetical protein N7468_009900 [Penicillium chermesinum]|uniref:Uncharacterized protein n=1 Tax=Penicillium chermesinum TaxID=63820 RepID=A0A9W9NBN1_9EURO|nr:uncharacterized protein N7468_009900 [Penicillium chermesinum]KAJ5216892.1 hypothetical protein N7468_009900 [Penicillium chermesinum]KAJ6171495.1 hypothetical protein N7470_000562 [Penicillium chermesinum]
MPTALGCLQKVSSWRITGSALFDGIPYSFDSPVSPYMPNFDFITVTIEYNEEGDLKGEHSWSGKFETDTFQLTADNGLTIKGRLNPGIPAESARAVKGTLVWRNLS